APRHVEIQVFADSAGNTVHLGERDCSVQRRHQKVVEEAPCPVMTPELREKMGAAAVVAAKSIDYLGAGTVEFLLDSEGAFYFLEMNTRLQVEHPVTELVTGLDLVALQLQVAQGEPLGLSQQDVSLSGHAIEVRLYSEDPSQGFLPTSGTIELWKPANGAGVRVDAGVCSGQEISPFYDPMVAKVIASGPTREVARRRLIKALDETLLYGVKSNKSFLIACLQKPAFINGTATTAFIGEEFDDDGLAESVPNFAEAAVAAVLDIACDFEQHYSQAVDVSPVLRDWSSAGALVSQRCYIFGDESYALSISPLASAARRAYRVSDGDTAVEIEILEFRADSACVLMDGDQHNVFYARTPSGGITVSFAGHSAQFIDQNQLAGAVGETAGGGQVIAPMHGTVLELLVESGQRVTQGQGLLVLEAMKMQHEIVAAADGTVGEVFASSGAQVAADQLLVEIDVDD
ncbi:MAG: hypothetical protein KJP04_05675, partial [Arenicella sp.]|nr:hypothetical protein [Arenicella sp.]